MALTSRSYSITATPVTILAHILVIAITILMLVWLLHFQEGLAYKSNDKKQKILNLHALLMILGPVLTAGEAILLHHTIHARRSQKMVHLTFHLIALIVGIMGIYATFEFHKEIGLWNMYTLHSWLGIITICSFGLQWLLAFFTFFAPGAEKSTRARFSPWHIFIGMVIFILAICTTEIGLAQTFISLGLRRSQEALIVNFIGLLIFLFSVSITLVVVLPHS